MESIEEDALKCVSYNGETTGAHICKVCRKFCHSTSLCASVDEDKEEGYGSNVLCLGCAADQSREENVTITTNSERSSNNNPANANPDRNLNAFQLLMKAKQSPTPSVSQSKRPKAGHEKTRSAVCLVCFKQYKKDNIKKFWFARFNGSTKKDHMKVHNCSEAFISCDDPRAAEALAAFGKEMESRNKGNSSKVKRQKLDPAGPAEVEGSQGDSEIPSEIEAEVEDKVDEQILIPKSPLPGLDDVGTEIPNTADEPTLFTATLVEAIATKPQSVDATSSSAQQTSLDKFFTSKSAEHNKTVLDYIADKIGERISNSKKPEVETSNVNVADNETKKSLTSNLSEFLSEEPDMELIGENDTWILRCKACHIYLNNPIASSAMKYKPTGESLATGLTLTATDYQKHCQGICSEWRRLKHRMLTHLSGSSKTHRNAAEYLKEQRTLANRQRVSIRNQLRTAIGVVQTKCAATHYETRIAELYQAGADVGDFGHSRILFPQMIDVACHFINQGTREYLSTNLPSTGMPPHYYVSADKSTNHRVSNQATMVCPVVEGKKTAIPLGMSPVYVKSDGSGGKGEELADGIFNDLKNHLDVKGVSLLQMQGKVTDGQYINGPFVARMNEPIFDVLRSLALEEEELEIVLEDKWWECHWDPGHWLDKVFSKFKEESFVSRLLGRVALFHQIFRHGKMHSIAKETAKELNLPFRVTNAYAPQRFMSSSYLSLKRLEISYEAYVETFRDHHNEEEMRYKLCGNDFVFDLCGLLDLLWPIVVLMLKAQLQWCPGWKFPAYVDAAVSQIELFSTEILKQVPSKTASPRLNKHARDIHEYRFKSVELEPGWIIVGREANGDFKWLARDTKDCKRDLKALADGIKGELKERFKTSFPELNHTLHKCLDFGMQFNELCGQRTTVSEVPVNKASFAKIGTAEFKQCVAFVSSLPHVKALNLALCEELSSSIYWRFKEKLIDVVWGELFQSLFPTFFKAQEKTTNGLKEIQLKESSFIKSFQKADTTEFSLTESYSVFLSDGRKETVFLQEQEIIKALYTNPKFYSSIGQEFCIIFDIMYAKTGTESVVESLYGVVRNQEMDGGQSIKVLGDRAKVDWCFPPVLDCARALDEMAKLYVNGDSSLGVKKHHVPVYRNRKSFRQSDELSKVLTRIKESRTGLSFLR